MELTEGLVFVRQHRQGILATLKRNGRPQLSNIVYLVTDDETIQISVAADRAKTRNLMRDQRASLHVTSGDFWAYCVVEADVELLPPAGEPNDATVDALVDYYRTMSGEHPDWDDYRRAMVAEGRLLLHLHPTHAYGQLPR